MWLQHLIQRASNGALPQPSVVVTFDDGYADNFHKAKPILERYDVPATYFITIGAIGNEREFWWDELDKMLLQSGTLPVELRLNINGRAYSWELGEAAYYSEAELQLHRSWRTQEDAPSARHSLYRALWQILHSLTTDERQKVLDELLMWAGIKSVSRASHRTLSLDEMAALAQGGLIEIGAHTVNHPSLSALPAASQRDEIRQSKNRLEEILGRPVTSFAYPFGKRGDYTSETVDIVQEVGFTCACSNIAGAVGRATDRYQLPRIYVQDCDGDKFAKLLSKWLPVNFQQSNAVS